MWPKRKSLTGPIRTIPPPLTRHQTLIPEIVRGKNQKSLWCSGRVQDWRSRGPWLKLWCGQKENLSQVQSKQYHYQSLCTRFIIPQIVRGKNQKSLWCSGRVQDWRSRGPWLKLWCGQKENLSQVQSEQYHHQSLCIRLKYLKLSEVKNRIRCGAVVGCRTRDPEDPGWNPGVAKKKISHRSNRNSTTTNPSAPELNTWNCQRWKPEVAMAQW